MDALDLVCTATRPGTAMCDTFRSCNIKSKHLRPHSRTMGYVAPAHLVQGKQLTVRCNFFVWKDIKNLKQRTQASLDAFHKKYHSHSDLRPSIVDDMKEIHQVVFDHLPSDSRIRVYWPAADESRFLLQLQHPNQQAHHILISLGFIPIERFSVAFRGKSKSGLVWFPSN
jgi:hypothetical protein